MDQTFFHDFLTVTKDYWFLITLCASVLLTAVYMIVFRVNPWDQQRSAKLRRDRVRFHNAVGYKLIEAGHFKHAQDEFEEALKLSAEDQTAITGLYLAECFTALQLPEWNPAIGFAIQHQISEMGGFDRELNLHIICKYLGDLHQRISSFDIAKEYYSKALTRKPDYPDALFTKGWLIYELETDIDGMERAFRKMTEVDSRDYRGFHGLGYSLYMKAIAEADVEKRAELMSEASRQSSSAKDLVYNHLNIIMDFGEVARSVDPWLSLSYREYARKVMNDPVLSQVKENTWAFSNRFLMKEGKVYLETLNSKLAWIEYQIALDYLAMERKQADPEFEKKRKEHLERAEELDSDKIAHDIYEDQLAVLDLLLPAKVAQEGTQPDA
jgi:tetratricopeptide (TPR) repeat protein